ARPLYDDGLTLVQVGARNPVHRVREWFEHGELLRGYVVGQPVQPRAGADLHVLAVTAPEPDTAVADHVGVPVHAKRRDAQDLVDRDPVTLGDAELGVGRERGHTPHRLMARNDGERARSGHPPHAVALRAVAATAA